MTTNNTTDSNEQQGEPCAVCKFHWNTIVMPGQTHNRNCPYFDERDDGSMCQGCRQRYKMDIEIPDSLWERIKPEGKPKGAGLLCGRCIFARVEALGEHGDLTLTPRVGEDARHVWATVFDIVSANCHLISRDVIKQFEAARDKGSTVPLAAASSRLPAEPPPTPPRCPKCGYVMCQQFDSRPVNAIADIATPNGKYVCYYCTPAEPRQEGKQDV